MTKYTVWLIGAWLLGQQLMILASAVQPVPSLASDLTPVFATASTYSHDQLRMPIIEKSVSEKSVIGKSVIGKSGVNSVLTDDRPGPAHAVSVSAEDTAPGTKVNCTDGCPPLFSNIYIQRHVVMASFAHVDYSFVSLLAVLPSLLRPPIAVTVG